MKILFKFIKGLLITIVVIAILCVIALLISCATKGTTFTQEVKLWYDSIANFFGFMRAINS